MKPKLLEQFADLRERNVITVKQAKEKGTKVVGMYCVYSPQELVLAAGAVPVSLCGTKQEPIAAAERELPRNMCPLIKSSYGYAVSDTCPYFYFADLLIAETTCDGKKKMYEMLSKIKPMQVLQLPQGQTGPENFQLWLTEIHKTKARLEQEFGVEITEERLRAATKLANRERKALRELHGLNRDKPAPLSGLDLLSVIWVKGFNVEKERGIEMIEALTTEIKALMAQGVYAAAPAAPRLLVTGVPIGIGSEKVLRLIEAAGGSVVALENCSGYKPVSVDVDEAIDKDPLVAIAEKYLATPCACMSPNPGRYQLLAQLVKEYQVDGVVDLTWVACHTYNIESFNIRKFCQEELQVPCLQLETDYSESDLEQLRVRIEAFLEMLN